MSQDQHSGDHQPRGPHDVHARRNTRSHTVFLMLFAVAIFLLGVLIVFSVPSAEAGIRRLMGSFAPGISTDYSPNRGSAIAPQRPLPTP